MKVMRTKMITGAVFGAIVGFFAGYFMFAEDLSISQVVFGADTGVELFNKVGNSFMENERLKVLLTSLGGLIVGALFPAFSKK